MSRVGVIGTTSWGTTLGIVLARNGHEVSLWARTPAEAKTLDSGRSHRFLPGVDFPDNLKISDSADQVFTNADLALSVVPTNTVTGNVERLREQLRQVPLIVSATKGIQNETGKPPTRLIRDALGGNSRCRIGVISGPNLAPEVVAGMPTSATVAFDSADASEAAQAILTSPRLRVYASTDVTGVELGGALKNIIAIGAGVIDGLGMGDNGKSAFITRGLAEITRLGVAMGAEPETFAGLSGLGDLVATCYSGLSRNRGVGEQLAKGRKASEILEGMDQVAEGVNTTRAALGLAAVHDVDMPITALTARVLFDDLDPREALEMLMSRAPQAEVRR